MDSLACQQPLAVWLTITTLRYTLICLLQDFELCIRAENVVLPKNGFFGLSAATGGLADDHDVLKFITHSLRSPELSLGNGFIPCAVLA
jgi:hypothetical protein